MKAGESKAEMSSTGKMSWTTMAYRVLRRPWRENRWSLRFRFKRVWSRLLPAVPIPVRLPGRIWWLARNDVCGDAVFTGCFEESERRFVTRFLQEGMTVLDIGAHHGIYTLLAAMKVGRKGCVIAFEPSPRERGRLLAHLRLNRISGYVTVCPLALSRDAGEGTLFVVEGTDTGCNSLRPPRTTDPTRAAIIHRIRLDDYLRENKIDRVDFIKMDVEGGELDVLDGATELLSRPHRPVILTEIDDSRTAPWGYAAAAIFDFLAERDYAWFSIAQEGTLRVAPRGERYSGNLLAFPRERLQQASGFMQPSS
jgi:FkbM family methyltransferase